MWKERIKKLAPYAMIDGARRAAHFGLSMRCPICDARLRGYKTTGYGYPMLDRLQVVGGLRRLADSCPVCHGSSRDRLIKFYLEREVLGAVPDDASLRVLHMAPEKGLSAWLSSLPRIDYAAGDLEPARYYHRDDVRQMDMTALDLPDGALDLLLCCHIMEHIPNDDAAMREVARVLAPGGRALLQTPIALRAETIDEDVADLDDATRIRRFGQKDHVRLYTDAGYVARLQAAGLAVERWRAFDADEDAAAALRLDPFEVLYVCRRA